jgi:hypothetical protein
MSLNNKNVLFVHIPKTGGMCLSQYLSNNKNFHNYIHKILRFDNHKYKDFYKISIIRDPVEKLISGFFYYKSFHIKTNGTYHPLLEILFKKYEIYDFVSFKKNYNKFFENEIEPLRNKLEYLNKNEDMCHYNLALFFPMHWFICDAKNNILVDKIIKNKNLNKMVKRSFNITITKKINTHANSKMDYSKLLTDDERNNLKKHYLMDYQIFKNYI